MTADEIVSALRADASLARALDGALKEARIAVWRLDPYASQTGGKYVPGWVCESVAGRRVGFAILGRMWADTARVPNGPDWNAHPRCTSDRNGIARVTSALFEAGWMVHPPETKP